MLPIFTPPTPLPARSQELARDVASVAAVLGLKCSLACQELGCAGSLTRFSTEKEPLLHLYILIGKTSLDWEQLTLT